MILRIINNNYVVVVAQYDDTLYSIKLYLTNSIENFYGNVFL